jgi:hypothetical protein
MSIEPDWLHVSVKLVDRGYFVLLEQDSKKEAAGIYTARLSLSKIEIRVATTPARGLSAPDLLNLELDG